MLIGEPSRSPYDLHFRVLGIPVRVHPFFWVVALLLGIGGNKEPANMLVWVGAVFVSILVHELGHALTARMFGWQPWITLYGMGGLASYQPTYRNPIREILITLAGPGAGFFLAALVTLAIMAAGHQVQFVFSLHSLPVRWEFFDTERANRLIFDLLYINIFWGLVNLLPIYPLDGGQISRELFTLVDAPSGPRSSLWLSVFAAAGMAVVALVKLGDQFLALFFGYLAYMSFQDLQGGRGGYR